MVYLIHFNEHFKHALHYIGFVDGDENLPLRMAKHQSGNGSKLMAAISKAGIKWNVVRVWEGADRNFERSLKNRKKSSQLCPICKMNKTNKMFTPKQIQEFCVLQLHLNKDKYIEHGIIKLQQLCDDFIFQHALEDEGVEAAVADSVDKWWENTLQPPNVTK